MKETRKIEIELSNKTRQTAECTISKFCEESTIAAVTVEYQYQLPINHSLFNYFDENHSEHYDVHRELLERGATSLIVYKSETSTNASVYALETSAKTGQFLTKFNTDNYDGGKLKVGYITGDGKEYVADTILNYCLHVMIDRYEHLMYLDVFDSTYEQSDYYIRKIRLVKE